MKKPPKFRMNQWPNPMYDLAERLHHAKPVPQDLELEPVSLDEVVRYCIPEAKIGEPTW